MSGYTIIFYLLAAMILICGALSVTTRHIFRAAIYLLFSLIGVAGLYFWIDYQFIAAVQIVVYVGGIVVLIIFSIFLTHQTGELLPFYPLRKKIFPVLAVICAFLLTIMQVFQHEFATTTAAASPQIKEIGQQMLNIDQSGYALPFEIISILLLAALVGSIVIAAPGKENFNNKQEIRNNK